MSTDLLDTALAAARAAARLVRDRRTSVVEVAATKTSDVDVVTEADRASERLIRQLILESRPDDAFIGEEGDDIAGSSGVRWIVDPIDGTVNFLYNRPEYAVSIAAEVDGRSWPASCSTSPPVTSTPLLAAGGATRGGQDLRVRAAVPLGQRLLATGFSYGTEARALQADGLTRLLPRVRDIRRGGSCALDLCHVAEGTADGYLEEGVNLWDYAAGALIAEEAGAAFRVRPGRWGGFALVSGPADGFEELVGLVDEIGFFGE